MPTAKIAPTLDIPLALDHAVPTPLWRQLRDQLRHMMLDGRLAGRTRLPSTRALAQALGVSRTVTSAAYDDLCAEGYLAGRHGSGTYVSGVLAISSMQGRKAPDQTSRWHVGASPVTDDLATEPGLIAFHLGLPSLASLSPRVWRSAWRSVAERAAPASYGALSGELALREELARYLGRSRGIVCRPEEVVLTTGTTHGLDLVARTLLTAGDSVGIEEPGYPTARQVLCGRGLTLLPIPVDDDGLVVERLPIGEGAPLLIYTTPSHHYPLGTRLSLTRRMSLLAWAERHDALIVEDDYDSEFRYDASPLPALASLDQAGRVIYLGTFSKVLSPALRVGYLVASAPLRERIVRLQRETAEYPSWAVQRMLATFIAEGHLDRHIRRMRHEYAHKRQLLVQTLAPVAHLAHPVGLDAGLHILLMLGSDLDAHAIVRAARRRGVLVTPLAAYYAGTPDRSGLLLGYGGLTPMEISRGGTVVAEVIARAAAGVTAADATADQRRPSPRPGQSTSRAAALPREGERR